MKGKAHILKAKRLQTERRELEEAKMRIELLEDIVKDNEERLAMFRSINKMSRQELCDEIENCKKNHHTNPCHGNPKCGGHDSPTTHWDKTPRNPHIAENSPRDG